MAICGLYLFERQLYILFWEGAINCQSKRFPEDNQTIKKLWHFISWQSCNKIKCLSIDTPSLLFQLERTNVVLHKLWALFRSELGQISRNVWWTLPFSGCSVFGNISHTPCSFYLTFSEINFYEVWHKPIYNIGLYRSVGDKMCRALNTIHIL